MKDNDKGNEKPNDSIEKEGKEYETDELIKILTRDETAKMLRVDVSTVSRYAKSGELRSYKLGTRRLFKYVDVLAFFENLVDREYVFGQEL